MSRKRWTNFCAGNRANAYLRRNAKGAIDGVVREEPPQQGANVYLTLDARIQSIAEEALRAVSARRGSRRRSEQRERSGDGFGAVIRSEHFHSQHQGEGLEVLQKDEANPLVNRAISAFPPGSTFKIVTALAGLRKIYGYARFNCSGGVSYGDHYFQLLDRGETLAPTARSAFPTRSKFHAIRFSINMAMRLVSIRLMQSAT